MSAVAASAFDQLAAAVERETRRAEREKCVAELRAEATKPKMRIQKRQHLLEAAEILERNLT